MKKQIVFWSTITYFTLLHSQPPSLQNCGNTCYLNATIQALYNIRPVTNWLLGRPNPYQTGTLPFYYVNLIQAFNSKANHDIQLQAFVNKADSEIQKLAGGGRLAQQDATELIRYLLNQLKENHKNLGKIFTFETDNLISCTEKPRYVQRVSDEQHISLEISIHQNNATLKDYLDRYFAREKLPDDFAPYGDPRDDCYQQTFLRSIPEIFIISLKRFQRSLRTNTIEKIEQPIAIPFELNLNQYLSRRNKFNAQYELISAIDHRGTFGGGHYVAYIKDNKAWYICDDSRIDTICLNPLSKGLAKSYVFVYQKIQPTPTEIDQLQQLKSDLQKLANRLQQLEEALRRERKQ